MACELRMPLKYSQRSRREKVSIANSVPAKQYARLIVQKLEVERKLVITRKKCYRPPLHHFVTFSIEYLVLFAGPALTKPFIVCTAAGSRTIDFISKTMSMSGQLVNA